MANYPAFQGALANFQSRQQGGGLTPRQARQTGWGSQAYSSGMQGGGPGVASYTEQGPNSSWSGTMLDNPAAGGITGGNMMQQPLGDVVNPNAPPLGQRQDRLNYRTQAASNPGNTGIVPPTPQPAPQPAYGGYSRPYGQQLQGTVADVRNQLGVGANQEGPNAGIVNQFLRSGASAQDIVSALRNRMTAQGDYSGSHGSEQRQAFQQWQAQHGGGGNVFPGRSWASKAQNQAGYQRPPQYGVGGGAPQQFGAGGGPELRYPSNNTGIPVTTNWRNDPGSPINIQRPYSTPPTNIPAGNQPGIGVSRTRPDQPGMSSNDPRRRPPIGTGATQGPRNIY